MYNLCIFIFIIYAVSYSVSEILFKRKRQVAGVRKHTKLKQTKKMQN